MSGKSVACILIHFRYSSRQSTVSYPKGEKPVLAKAGKKFRQSAKSISQSAPSIVNLGSSQVKFEPKVKTAIVSPRKLKKNSIECHTVAQEEIVLLQGEETGEGVAEMLQTSDLELDGEMEDVEWAGSEEELSRQASSYITENTEDSLAFDNNNTVLTCVYLCFLCRNGNTPLAL